MATAPLPANMILLRPQAEFRAAPSRAPRLLPPVSSQAQLLKRLDTIGALAPSAPLSFLMVRFEGVPAAGRDRALRQAAARIRELIRSTDCLGRFTPEGFGIVLQGTGSTAASAVAARLTHHLDQLLATEAPGAHALVYAATGIGAVADVLPAAAMDSLDDCC